jgi:hypothetical protein
MNHATVASVAAAVVAADSGGAMVYDKRMQPGQETLTPISTRPVRSSTRFRRMIDAGFFDMWMRPVYDFGKAGPNKGKGDRILILPPGYDGPVPDGYQVWLQLTEATRKMS